MLGAQNINGISNFNNYFYNKLVLLFIIIIFLTSNIYSTNVPSTVTLRQPNGYTFTALGEGDEFLHRFKTMENYTIICNSDNWWHYAYLGNDGKLYPTSYRVGREESYARRNLITDINYSQQVIDAANLQRTSFNNSLSIQPLGPVSVGVILIDFPDRIASRINPSDPSNLTDLSINDPANSSWAKRYSMSDFQNLFFSTNTYNTTSPDGYTVYGSLNDYWKEVSYNQISITGAILNNTDSNGKPIWYRADSNSNLYTHSSLRTEAISKAIAAGFPVNNYSKICVVFAGTWGGNLWPSGGTAGWWMGERNIGWDGNLGFASIGVHAHESGHTLGLPDLYDGTYQTNGVGGYSLMGLGNYGALINNHARPVHPLAYEKIRLGFFNPEPVISNSLNKNVPSIKLSP